MLAALPPPCGVRMRRAAVECKDTTVQHRGCVDSMHTTRESLLAEQVALQWRRPLNSFSIQLSIQDAQAMPSSSRSGRQR